MLIGSMAMRHWFPDFNRKPKDTDYAVSLDISSNDKNIEYLYNPVLDYLYHCDENDVIFPEILLTLKMSHIFWNINFDKHMWDIQFLLDKGIKYDKELLLRLYDFWEKYLPQVRRSNLKMTSKDFFNNAIKSEIPHDDLHELLIKHEYFNQKVPTYSLILKDGEEVEPDENKFNKLTYEQKFNLVIEEVCVMDYERYKELLFPQGYVTMLKKFLRDHAPMWEKLFIIENWKELIKPKFNHYKHLDYELKRNKQTII